MALARPGQPEPDSGFLAWWLGELRGLLPRRWRGRASGVHTLLLQVERPFARVYERRGGAWNQSGASWSRMGARRRRRRSSSRACAGPWRGTRTRRSWCSAEDALTCTDLLPAATEATSPGSWATSSIC